MLTTSTVFNTVNAEKSLLHSFCGWSPSSTRCTNPQLDFGQKNGWYSCLNLQPKFGQKNTEQAKLSTILGRRKAMVGVILPLHLAMFQTSSHVKAEQLYSVSFGFDGLGKDVDDYAVAKVVGLAEAGEGALIFLGIDGFKKPLSMAVGAAEAIAVLTAAQERTSSRPVTHEAWGSSLAAVGWKVDRVAITSLQKDVFYSRVVLSPTEQIPASTRTSVSARSIDVRPSDAIALALRCRAPLFVSKHVADVAVNKSAPKELIKPPELEAHWLLPPVSLQSTDDEQVKLPTL